MQNTCLKRENESGLPCKISEFQLVKLKREINQLMDRISVSLAKENYQLKEKIQELKKENLKLRTMLNNGCFLVDKC